MFAKLLVLCQVLSHPYLCRFDEEHSVFLRDTTLAMFEDNMQVHTHPTIINTNTPMYIMTVCKVHLQ